MARKDVEALFQRLAPIYELVYKCTEAQEKIMLDSQEHVDSQLELITSRTFIISILCHILYRNNGLATHDLHKINNDIGQLLPECYSTPMDKSQLIQLFEQAMAKIRSIVENSDSDSNDAKPEVDSASQSAPLNLDSLTISFKEATYKLFQRDWDRRTDCATTLQDAVVTEVNRVMALNNQPVATDAQQDDINKQQPFTSLSADMQLKTFLQELDQVMASLQRDLRNKQEGLEPTKEIDANFMKNDLHAKVSSIGSIVKGLDDHLCSAAMAPNSTTSFDDFLQEYSSSLAKPTEVEYVTHPSVLKTQGALADYVTSANKFFDQFIIEWDSFLKKAPVKIFANILLNELNTNPDALTAITFTSETLNDIDALINSTGNIIKATDAIGTNLATSYSGSSTATDTITNLDVDALASSAEDALSFIESKFETPSAPALPSAPSPTPCTAPLKAIISIVRDLLSSSDDECLSFDRLVGALLPSASYISALLPSHMSAELATLAYCASELISPLKATTEALTNFSATTLQQMSPLLHTQDPVQDTSSTHQRVTSSLLRPYSKSYASAHQLLKQLHAQLERAKQRILEQYISDEEVAELRKERESYSRLESETQFDKLIGNLMTTYICPTCRDELSNSFLTGCGHIACTTCLHNMYETRTRKCPMCQKPYKQEDIVEFAVIR